MKIVFMGSSEFSRIILEYLIENGAEIICVYTRAPKRAGRGHKLAKTVVHEYAEKQGLEIKYPLRLKSQDTVLQEFKDLGCEVAVVASYGLIIPEDYLAIPKLGFINVHPSSLPLYRGAAPIQRTILSGDMQTSSCIMQMDSGLDTGDILKRTEVDIANRPTYIQLHDKLAKIGAKDLLEVLRNPERFIPLKQDDELATYANKITKDEGIILSGDIVEIVERKYRALNPWPGLIFKFGDEEIKLCEAVFDFADTKEEAPGSILWGKKEFKIVLKGGFIIPKILQRPGKSKVDAASFINGLANKISRIS